MFVMRMFPIMSIGLLVATTISACGADEHTPPPTADELRDPLIIFLIQSKELTTTESWRAMDFAYPSYCDFRSSQRTSDWIYDLLSPRGKDPKGDAQKVAEYWRSRGMHVEIVESGKFPTVYASGGPVRTASFETETGEGEYKIGSSTYCGVGDAVEILEGEKLQRRAGRHLLGDDLYRPISTSTQPSD